MATLAEAKKQIVLEALDRNSGHRTKTAAELDISLRTLERWLAAWKISADRQNGATQAASDSL